MFFILLAIILIVAIWVCARRIKYQCGIILFMAIAFGVLLPTAGYESWEALEETQLVSITDQEDFYINYHEPGGYGYCYNTKSPYYYGAYVKNYNVLWIADSDMPIKIEVDASYTEPVLVYYKVNPKRNFWTFALLGERRQHVFYVPPGTIR